MNDEPERFTQEEVREMQGFSDNLVLTSMTLHGEIEEEFGPVAEYKDDGLALVPEYVVGTYLAILGDAIESEDQEQIETAFTIVLASFAAIKGIAAIDMEKSIIENGDEIIEE